MKHWLVMSIFIASILGVPLAPFIAQAQTTDIPVISEDASFIELRGHHARLSTLLVRLEQTLPVLKRRGQGEEIEKKIEETKESFALTRGMLQKREEKLIVVQDRVTADRALLIELIRSIRSALNSR